MAIKEDEISNWLFDVLLRREVLEDFEKPMSSLAKMCRSRDEFELLAHTIEKLVALSQKQFTKQIISLVGHIKKLIVGEQQIAIVAMAWGDEPDSSQQLVQLLKTYFHNERRVRFFNSVNNFEKKDHIQTFPRFIIVDEFSGTGKTVIGRVNHLYKHAKSKNVEIEPYVYLLFGMQQAYDNIKGQGIDAHFCNILKAGISGYFTGEERSKRIAIMKRLEEELHPQIDGKQLPSLGYGEAEALFFVRNMNAPNSNFPIFWWPIDASGNDRDTIMQRAEL